MKTCIKHQLRIAAFAATALVAGTASATELVVNGDFSQIMVGWSVGEVFGSSIPYEHPAGTISLQPQSQDLGTLVSQTLNVDGIASQTVGVSIDLGGDWEQPEGNSIAVYLEYIDTTGDRQRAKVLNPDNATMPQGSLVTYSTNYVFPASAVRLVAISIDKEGDEWLRADNVSITSPALSADPIPHLQSLSPSGIAYGNTLSISGSHFGSTPGTVFIDGTTNGVVVQSWADGLIEVLVGTDCTGGNVQIDALGSRTMEKRNLSITSPGFSLEASPATRIALAGQPIQVDVRTAFSGHLATTNGVQLSVVEAPLAGTFSPNPVMGDGGSLLSFNTTGLAAGTHTFTVQGQETNSADRSTEFKVDIRTIDTFDCEIGGTPLDGYTFTAQAPVSAMTTVTDTLGNDITTDLPKPTWTTDTPGVIEVFQETSPWGSLYLLPHATGSATITATLPGGSLRTFSVSVTIPTKPSFLSNSFSNSIMSNNSALTNQFASLASGPMSNYGWSVSDLYINSYGGFWNGDNSGYTWKFSLEDNQKPGTYKLTSNATVDGTSISEGILFQVINDPSTGLVKGHVALFGGNGYEEGASGSMEFYDTATGSLALTVQVWEWTADYTIPLVPPGTYKLRFIADGGLDQWYPNAASSNTASAVAIAAGATVDQINFTLAPSNDPIPDPPVSTPPSYDPASGTFSFGVQTENGKSYEFRKSATLEEGSWFVLQTVWGDGLNVTLEDTGASNSAGFYRVVPQ